MTATWTATVAITPPADIVLDVARAADPQAYREAVERLSRLRAATAGPEPFTVPEVPAPATAASSTTGPAATAVDAANFGQGARTRQRQDAYGQFESFILQSFIQSMLPKNASSVFGKGSAGEFWKSMLAEKMGDELARSGQIGIARRLSAGPVHPVRPSAGDAAASLTVPPSLASTLTHVPSRMPEGADPVAPSTIPAPVVSERS